MQSQKWIDKRKEIWEKNHDIEYDRQYRLALAEEIITNEQFRNEILEYPEILIELEFVIVNKKKQVVPFFLNDVQKDFAQKIRKARIDHAEGRLPRIQMLVLKGRQQGFTSFITAYQLAYAITQHNFEGFTLADVISNSQTIFENKAKFPLDSLPEVLKPTQKFNNKKELRFNKLNSAWEVSVASNHVGRSRTINFFHGSEAAFWPVEMSDLYAAIQPALTEDCVSIYETTANGFNDFKDMWDSGTYVNCFYEWWRTAEYVVKFESPAHEEEFRDIVENGHSWIADRLRWLKAKGLEEDQMYWYYKEYINSPDKEKIKQEYPCTPHEAFLMSGRPVFNIEKIVDRIDQLKGKPYKEGYFRFEWENPEVKDRIIDSTIEFIESKEKPWIRIYEEAIKGTPYVIGGDTKGEGSDYYTATVVNNSTGNRAATLHLQIMTSYPYTHQIYCMGRYYNSALVGVEINFNTGPVEELTRLRYPKQYVRRKFDDYTKKLETRFGWKTDGNTRPLIIDKYADILQNNIDLINDIPTLEEALTFVYDDKGRPDAMAGKHDDLILSDMIANQIREQQEFITEKEKARVGKYTKDMLEDFNNGSPEDKKRMIEMWGRPY